MKWTIEAEVAIQKVPFFVRKRVRKRVENEVAGEGKSLVTLDDVKTTQARFLSRMETDIKGYRVETCFGAGGCPHRANVGDALVQQLEAFLAEADLLKFLKERVNGSLKYHHEFRIALADCPNACSQPQIRDIGVIGACVPEVMPIPCPACAACVKTCLEAAITLDGENPLPDRNAPVRVQPFIQMDRCLSCGACARICPAGTIKKRNEGYRVLLAGKLGRHPRLARELPGIFSEDGVLSVVKDCVALYRQRSKGGERFAEIFTDDDFRSLRMRHDATRLDDQH